MNVTLPRTWKEFVDRQIQSGEFENPSEVVREGLRLLRSEQEARAMSEMQAAFAGVDAHGGSGEPNKRQRTLIDQMVKRHRRKTNGG
jgi:putative addiction module CopG family antidote